MKHRLIADATKTSASAAPVCLLSRSLTAMDGRVAASMDGLAAVRRAGTRAGAQ